MSNLCYRQIHLDFHTSELIRGIGSKFNGEEFARTLKTAGVDSVTCFSKCHHGMIYHTTRFPAKHPHLECNLLQEQIEACHKHGIRVPVYISVGYDKFMDKAHLEWVEIDQEGRQVGVGPLEAGWKKLCFNSPYIDYVVEQTEEVLDLFETDALFFDIVGQGECLCGYCMSGMIREGYDPEAEVDRRRYADIIVAVFKERMTAAIRRKNSECGIFYNSGHVSPAMRPSLSAYTHLELESLPSGGWGYEHFPITARYARNLGYEFLGMTGKFHKSWADFGTFKNPAALEYECFSALALGGGCSVGDQLHPAGRLMPATYDLIGGVYRQVEARELWCRGTRAVTEIGIVTPEVICDGSPFALNEAASGAYRMLGERHYQYDFIDFEMDLSGYKVIILPDIIRLTPVQAEVMNGYLSRGGRVLLSYVSGMASEGYGFLIDGMPVGVKGEARWSPDYLVTEEEIGQGIPVSEHVMYERGLELEALPGGRALAAVHKPYFEREYRHFSSHFHTPVEGPAGYPGIVSGGNIVYIGYPIFGMYKRHGSRAYRDMTLNALKHLLSDRDRLVVSNAPTTADITLNYQAEQDRYILHVLHYIPERRCQATDTIEDIIPLHDIELSLLLPKEYTNAEDVVNGVKIDAVRAGGRLELTLNKVCGHAMISMSRA